MSLTDDALEQVGRLFKENAELRERVEQVAAQRDEWYRQNGLLRGERDAATARAEQAEARTEAARQREETWRDSAMQSAARAAKAEAALAELRKRLGNAEVEWAARWREPNGEEVYRSGDSEADARHFVRLWRERGVPGYVTGLEVISALVGEWQNADAPRTALERATDEQGGGDA